MARSVPVSSSRCFGMVRVCWPEGPIRRSFTWLPRWAWTTKPKRLKIAMTSSPERRFSLGMKRFKLHRDDQRRMRCQAQLGQILSLQVELHRFLKIPHRFIERLSLRYNRNLHALGDIV